MTKRPPIFIPNGSDKPGAFGTFCIVTAGSVLFCSKGVFAKLAYGHGLDPIQVLTLRMVFSLPFFVAIVIFSAGGVPQLPASDWLRLGGFGFLGYYLTSLVNFAGLQYVSVGLERVVLYTYPTIVLVITAFILRKRVQHVAWVAAGVTWFGIVCAFGGEARVPLEGGDVPLGSALIFASAVIYAVFIVISAKTITRVGPLLFAGISVGFSCIFMLVHYLMVYPASDLMRHEAPVYAYGIILAIFGTVAPSLLMSLGLKRAGSQRFAVMGAIGPVATLFLAWAVLGETPSVPQGAGLLLALAGGLGISLIKSDPQTLVPDASGDGPDPSPFVLKIGRWTSHGKAVMMRSRVSKP